MIAAAESSVLHMSSFAMLVCTRTCDLRSRHVHASQCQNLGLATRSIKFSVALRRLADLQQVHWPATAAGSPPVARLYSAGAYSDAGLHMIGACLAGDHDTMVAIGFPARPLPAQE